MVQRYFIEIAYDGTAYHGWQVQTNASSIQQMINECLTTILRRQIFIQGAGRTDTGVHARQTFAHFDLDIPIVENFINKCNSLLAKDIQIINCFKVVKDAHCRFDALSRTYEYFISKSKNPFYLNKAFYFYKDLDIELMNQASKLLLETTDFTSFSKLNTQTKTNNCKLHSAKWFSKNELLIFEIKADRFLRNMVRSLVGTILELGVGKISIDEFEKIINSKDRSKAGFSVPACGLYLKRVEYPSNVWA